MENMWRHLKSGIPAGLEASSHNGSRRATWVLQKENQTVNSLLQNKSLHEMRNLYNLDLVSVCSDFKMLVWYLEKMEVCEQKHKFLNSLLAFADFAFLITLKAEDISYFLS